MHRSLSLSWRQSSYSQVDFIVVVGQDCLEHGKGLFTNDVLINSKKFFKKIIPIQNWSFEIETFIDKCAYY